MKNLIKILITCQIVLAAPVFSKSKAKEKPTAAPAAAPVAKGPQKVLIVTKEQDDFVKLSEFLSSEMKGHFETQVVKINKDTSVTDFEKMITDANPKVMVVMDNQGVTLAKEYYKKNPKKSFPSVALMGLNFKSILKGDPNICGIAYEVPAYSMLTQFRGSRADKKLNKVLVFYRSSQFADTIKEAQELVKMEKIELVGIDVEKAGKPALEYFKDEGTKEIKSGKYDAVYVILDSVLMEKSLFLGFWLPTAKESSIPFLIGADKFVQPSINFAAFGMSPNLKEMSSQAAQMIETLAQGEKCNQIEDLIGVTKFMNEKKMDSLDIKVDENSKSDTNFLK